MLGSSAASRRHLCRLASRPSSDLQIRRRRCRGELVYKSTFNVANRRSTEARRCGEIRLALGAPGFVRFFLFFVCTLVTVEAWAVCVTWGDNVRTHLAFGGLILRRL